jgi:hypothetical protein
MIRRTITWGVTPSAILLPYEPVEEVRSTPRKLPDPAPAPLVYRRAVALLLVVSFGEQCRRGPSPPTALLCSYLPSTLCSRAPPCLSLNAAPTSPLGMPLDTDGSPTSHRRATPGHHLPHDLAWRVSSIPWTPSMKMGLPPRRRRDAVSRTESGPCERFLASASLQRACWLRPSHTDRTPYRA